MIFLSGDKVECSLALIALTLAAFLAAFDSITWIATICGIYFIGVLWGVKGLRYLGLKKLQYVSNLKTDGRESCGVCGGNSCKRHRPSRSYPRINVPKDFDDALENLLEQLLQTYISAWYAEFSSDEALVQQFRTSIATAAGNIVQRLFRLDIAAVIFNHLVPLALQHAQDWRIMVNQAKTRGGNALDYAADYLGPRIHPAAYSRDAELNYLRGLVTTLIPYLLPSTHFSINNNIILREILANWVLLPAMDALADPDNINTLVILSTYHEGMFTQTADSINVPLLHSWAMPPLLVEKTPNSLKPSLEEILNKPQLLYLFMQHIKETGPVHLLQFCLDIDDLSKRMLHPDMSVETEENLYAAAQLLYSSYLTPETSNYLHLPLHISKGIKKILEGGPGKIQELRTSRPLYQAHQEAHTILEITCLPSFHHSYQMYTLLCGQQIPAAPPRLISQNSSQGVSAGMGSRLSNQIGKIQRVLRTSAVDGSPYQPNNVYQAEEVDCSPRLHSIVSSYEDGGSRDLSTWRVTVPHVDGGGAQPLYMIAVHSVAQEKSWTVLRRDIDFYSLRTRLAEFHGDRELNDSPLPARKNQHPSLNTNRQRYQDFLQKLLAKPKLRSSELLHTFLTVSDLEPYSTYSTPDIGLFYQNVAHKLRKERGQHLDKFMKTFLVSINIKHEHTDVGVEPCSDHSLNFSQKKKRDLVRIGPFKNNLDLPPKLQDFQFVITNQPQHVKGACFCITEAVDSLLDVPPSIARVYWLTASLSYQFLDPVINKLLSETLVKLLSGGRAALVVKLLYATILGPKSNAKERFHSTSKADKRKQAQEGLSSLVPWWIFGLHSTWRKLMQSLLEPLQNASLNKQLAYSLLDQLVADLFPEIVQ